MRLIELKKDSVGFLDYKRKIARPDITTLQSTHPHDMRFEPFDHLPRVYSKAK
jgi:hypothetical protein